MAERQIGQQHGATGSAGLPSIGQAAQLPSNQHTSECEPPWLNSLLRTTEVDYRNQVKGEAHSLTADQLSTVKLWIGKKRLATQGATTAEMMEVLDLLFSAFPQGQTDDHTLKQRLRAFQGVLHAIPADLLGKAARTYMSQDERFPPSPGQLLTIVQAEYSQRLSDLRKLEAIEHADEEAKRAETIRREKSDPATQERIQKLIDGYLTKRQVNRNEAAE